MRRHIVFVAFPDVQVLDVTGPLEVFGRAARLLVERGLRRDLAYSVEIVGPTAVSGVCRERRARTRAESPDSQHAPCAGRRCEGVLRP